MTTSLRTSHTCMHKENTKQPEKNINALPKNDDIFNNSQKTCKITTVVLAALTQCFQISCHISEVSKTHSKIVQVRHWNKSRGGLSDKASKVFHFPGLNTLSQTEQRTESEQ